LFNVAVDQPDREDVRRGCERYVEWLLGAFRATRFAAVVHRSFRVVHARENDKQRASTRVPPDLALCASRVAE
jgi:hypothetical protein